VRLPAGRQGREEGEEEGKWERKSEVGGASLNLPHALPISFRASLPLPPLHKVYYGAISGLTRKAHMIYFPLGNKNKGGF